MVDDLGNTPHNSSVVDVADHVKNWSPKSFCIEMSRKPDGDITSSSTIDLMDWCPDVPEPHMQFAGAKKDERIYFDANLSTAPEIAKMMNETTCLKNKYKVVSNTAKGDNKYICCNCSTSRKKSDGENCRFRIIIRYDKEHKRWYMRKHAGHCLRHNGHTRSGGEQSATVSSEFAQSTPMSEYQKQSAQKCLTECIDNAKTDVDTQDIMETLVELRKRISGRQKRKADALSGLESLCSEDLASKIARHRKS